ncbi:MAG TPA: NAD(P)H-hydrate epimerase [Gemmataceae bacterium]|jgi:NAD(P)H-hydrate epimerase|nr:NAD(P)H-hydrate epimerase [Gemmataceae bacterium]
MFLTRAEVREIDRRAIEEFGVPGVVLMENAGRGAAELLMRLNPDKRRVVICCGKGNNGGDGFVIARHLDNRGWNVRVLLFAGPKELTGDAGIMYEIIQRAQLDIEVLPDLPIRDFQQSGIWIVDALFGTGLSGPVRAPFDQVIAAMNASGNPIFAVDIPSGLDCDTGQPLGVAVRAAATATFVAPKKGFAEPSAKQCFGEVHVIDIGVPRCLIGPGKAKK